MERRKDNIECWREGNLHKASQNEALEVSIVATNSVYLWMALDIAQENNVELLIGKRWSEEEERCRNQAYPLLRALNSYLLESLKG